MKRLGAVVCALAIFGGSASSASAAPEFFKSNVPHVGNTTFHDASGGISILRGGLEITCSSFTSVGKVTGAKLVTKMSVKYAGCVGIVGGSSVNCHTSAPPNKINTKKIDGELVEASETVGGPLTIALLLKPEVVRPFAKFKCSTLNVEVKGEVLAAIGPVAIPSHTAELRFEEKATEPFSCFKQRLLFVNGTAPCHNLFTASGGSELIAKDTITYSGTATMIEIHP